MSDIVTDEECRSASDISDITSSDTSDISDNYCRSASDVSELTPSPPQSEDDRDDSGEEYQSATDISELKLSSHSSLHTSQHQEHQHTVDDSSDCSRKAGHQKSTTSVVSAQSSRFEAFDSGHLHPEEYFDFQGEVIEDQGLERPWENANHSYSSEYSIEKEQSHATRDSTEPNEITDNPEAEDKEDKLDHEKDTTKPKSSSKTRSQSPSTSRRPKRHVRRAESIQGEYGENEGDSVEEIVSDTAYERTLAKDGEFADIETIEQVSQLFHTDKQRYDRLGREMRAGLYTRIEAVEMETIRKALAGRHTAGRPPNENSDGTVGSNKTKAKNGLKCLRCGDALSPYSTEKAKGHMRKVNGKTGRTCSKRLINSDVPMFLSWWLFINFSPPKTKANRASSTPE